MFPLTIHLQYWRIAWWSRGLILDWDTWYLHQDITYDCIRVFYATADADEEDVILCEKRTVESEYDDEFNDGED